MRARGGREIGALGNIPIMEADKKKPKANGSKASDLDFGSNSEIARKLQSYYGSLLNEEVPDRFTQLLAKLESSESAKKKD